MPLDLQGWPFLVLSLVAAGLIAGVLGANVIAMRIYMRERRQHAFSRSGTVAWLLSVTACFSGLFTPLLAFFSLLIASWALNQRQKIEADPSRLGPVFSLPKSPWRSGGAELPARVAVFNSVALLILSGLVLGAVYLSTQ